MWFNYFPRYLLFEKCACWKRCLIFLIYSMLKSTKHDKLCIDIKVKSGIFVSFQGLWVNFTLFTLKITGRPNGCIFNINPVFQTCVHTDHSQINELLPQACLSLVQLFLLIQSNDIVMLISQGYSVDYVINGDWLKKN